MNGGVLGSKCLKELIKNFVQSNFQMAKADFIFEAFKFHKLKFFIKFVKNQSHDIKSLIH